MSIARRFRPVDPFVPGDAEAVREVAEQQPVALIEHLRETLADDRRDRGKVSGQFLVIRLLRRRILADVPRPAVILLMQHLLVDDEKTLEVGRLAVLSCALWLTCAALCLSSGASP